MVKQKDDDASDREQKHDGRMPEADAGDGCHASCKEAADNAADNSAGHRHGSQCQDVERPEKDDIELFVQL